MIRNFHGILSFDLAAASGAVDEGIFEDAFNSSPAIPVKEFDQSQRRFLSSFHSSFHQAKMSKISYRVFEIYLQIQIMIGKNVLKR